MNYVNFNKDYRGTAGYAASIWNDSDLLENAYLQALSIKTTQSLVNQYALIVDPDIFSCITEKHREVFDEIVVMPKPWGFDKEWQIRNLTPWRKTIKLDVDVLIVKDMTRFWERVINNNLSLALSYEPKTFRDDIISSRWHRKLFDVNNLPDIYTAMYYFRDDGQSAEFFEYAAEVSKNWDWVAREFLVKNDNLEPRDDEIFSIAAGLYGFEKCLYAPMPKIVHLKEPLNELPTDRPWYEQVHVEPGDRFKIGHYEQMYPIHYIHKEFAQTGIIEYYERYYQELMEGTRSLPAARTKENNQEGYL